MHRRALRTVAVLLGGLLVAEPVAAHVGGLSGGVQAGSVPSWLTVVTGGVVVGASFLFTSLMTDHGAIRTVNGWRLSLPAPVTVRRVVRWSLRALSVGVLGLVVLTGLYGPSEPVSNFAILFVWAGWWAGYTISVYLVGNTWPVVNPWRALADLLPRVSRRSYPERLGVWPSVVGLLALVWVEVMSPLAEEPRLLVGLVIGYSAVTLLGAAVYGADTWFDRVDPISRAFRCYGRIAPVQRTDRGVEFKLPTAALTEHRLSERSGETAFVVALLWATTYDGLVTTPAWAAVTRAVVGVGVPALLVYAGTMVTGFVLFLGVYRLAARKVREVADSYVAAPFVERWFAPSLLPIAAGYHLAHYLSYFLTLLPALSTVAGQPFTLAADPQVLVLPAWFGSLQLGFVLLGHLLAVWVAHALAFELFPGTLTPIRSQYPFIVVMIFYTMTSMWIIAQPFTAPPFL